MRAWRPDLLDMLGFWYNDLTRAQDGFKVALVELRDADIYYVYSLADFSYYCGYSLVAAGLGIDRNLVLDYGRTSAWRLNFKNQTYPSNPGVNPDLIRPKTKKFPLDPQFKPTVQCLQKWGVYSSAVSTVMICLYSTILPRNRRHVVGGESSRNVKQHFLLK